MKEGVANLVDLDQVLLNGGPEDLHGRGTRAFPFDGGCHFYCAVTGEM